MLDFQDLRNTMVDTQVRPSDVTKFPIIDAMLTVPREDYLPEDLASVAYSEDALNAGGRVLLEPRTFAKILDALDLGPDAMVLDIGCGLGYSTAVLSKIANTVVAVENDPQRVEAAQENLSRGSVDNAAVIEGKLSEGAPKHGPYDVILVEGGVQSIPDALLEQISEGGTIAVIKVSGELGTVRIGTKLGGKITWRDAFNAHAPILDGFQEDKTFEL